MAPLPAWQRRRTDGSDEDLLDLGHADLCSRSGASARLPEARPASSRAGQRPVGTPRGRTPRPTSRSAAGSFSDWLRSNAGSPRLSMCTPPPSGEFQCPGSARRAIEARAGAGGAARAEACARGAGEERRSYAQRLAELKYEEFRLRGHGWPAHLTMGGARAPPVHLPALWKRLPDEVRPAFADVVAEVRETSCSPVEAIAALLVGRAAVAALQLVPSSRRGAGCFKSGDFEYRAWARAVRAAQTSAFDDDGNRVLAAVALLQPAEDVCRIDMGASALPRVPEAIGLYPAVQVLDLNRNAMLRCVSHVGGCKDLRVVDLSDCAALVHLHPLSGLQSLEALDLSRCVRVQSIQALTSEEPPPAVWEVGPFVSQAVAGDDAPRPSESEAAARPGSACRRSLRWLSACGCASLQHGVAELAACPALAHLDLSECLALAPSSCAAASRAPALQTFVWPDAAALAAAARAEGRSPAAVAAALRMARAAAGDKLERSRAGVRGVGLPASGTWARALEAAAAARAAEEWSAAAAASAEGPPAPVGLRVTPLAFVKALKLARFEVPGLGASDLFRLLDADGDGGLSVADVEGALAAVPPPLAEVDAVVCLLAGRHNFVWEAAAADLAGGRPQLDRRRVAACLVASSVEADLAARAAPAVVHCAACRLPEACAGDAEAAFRRALLGFAVARRAAAAAHLSAALRLRMARSTGVLDGLLRQVSGGPLSAEFVGALLGAGDDASGHAAFVSEVARSVAGAEPHNATLEDVLALRDVDFKDALAKLASIGRRLAQLPSGSRPSALRHPRCSGGSSILFVVSRADFAAAWAALPVGIGAAAVPSDVAFGLLDYDACGRLFPESIEVLLDVLPRRAELEAIPALAGFLATLGSGSASRAHSKLLDAQQAIVADFPFAEGGRGNTRSSKTRSKHR